MPVLCDRDLVTSLCVVTSSTCVFRVCRTVSRSEGEQLAARLDCAYFETSAAEDLRSVTTAFGRVLGDVLRLHDRQPTLQAYTLCLFTCTHTHVVFTTNCRRRPYMYYVADQILSQ